MYAEFGLEVPGSLREALEMLATGQGGRGRMLLAGGTNVLVDLRARQKVPDALITVGRLPELRGINVADGVVTLGGCTTVSDILRHPEMPSLGPALVDAARVFAGQMVRNAATLAGNICCGSPAADLVPALLALDAVVTLENSQGRREVSLAEFYTGYKRNIRGADDIVTRVTWPRPSPSSRSVFYKLARRKGDAITVVGVAVALTEKDGKCIRARIALGAVSPFVMRSTIAERVLEGEALTPHLIEAAAREASAQAAPIADVRASAEYRRQQVYVLTNRLVMQSWMELSQWSNA